MGLWRPVDVINDVLVNILYLKVTWKLCFLYYLNRDKNNFEIINWKFHLHLCLQTWWKAQRSRIRLGHAGVVRKLHFVSPLISRKPHLSLFSFEILIQLDLVNDLVLYAGRLNSFLDLNNWFPNESIPNARTREFQYALEFCCGTYQCQACILLYFGPRKNALSFVRYQKNLSFATLCELSFYYVCLRDTLHMNHMGKFN